MLEPVIAAQGYELIELELTRDRGRRVLRLYIDHPERPVSIDDTTKVSRMVDPVLDVEDPIDEAYDLEVSSPGLDRPLRLPEHFSRYAGERVRIKTASAVVGGTRRTFNGVLKGFHDGLVSVEVEGELYELPHEAILRARVEYQFDEEPRR